MTRRLCVVLVATSLVVAAAAGSVARGGTDPGEVVGLPLIARGAPFALGGPDTAPVCGVAAGDPPILRLPFDPRTCRRLIDRGAPLYVGNPNDAPACFVAVTDPED